MKESSISVKYKPGPRQQAMIDAHGRLGEEKGADVIEAAKVLSDELLHVAEILQAEVGVSVDECVGNRKARTEDRRVDRERPDSQVGQLHTQEKGWLSRI